MKEKNIILKTKKTDFLSMFKSMFWSTEKPEKSEEENILLNNDISDEVKKTLLESLEESDKLANNLFKQSYKVTTFKRNNLKEDAKIAIEKMHKEKAETKDKDKNSLDNERMQKFNIEKIQE